VPIGVDTSYLPGYSGLIRAVHHARNVVESCRAVPPRFRTVVTARRFPIIAAAHAILMLSSSYLAFSLRFDGNIPPEIFATYMLTLPWLFAVRIPIFMGFGLFSGLWRYSGVWDLWRIVLATCTSTLTLYLLVYQRLGPGNYPRSIVIIDAMLVILLVGGARLLWRVPFTLMQKEGRRRVLIVGAGDAGEMIVREMRRGSVYHPVGFIDDDRTKIGHAIHGVTVLGSRQDLGRILDTVAATEVLVAIPSAGPSLVRSLVTALEPYKLPLTTLPSLAELLSGKARLSQIRPVEVQDLLPRKEVALSSNGARPLLAGKRVLVTGAGGSIGSELCRQIAEFEPERLILYERYENSLYAIANDLVDRGAGSVIVPVIGDVTDTGRVDSVFAEHQPHVVFHAAAHKHVPLMEANPCEAVKNNVLGTQVVAEASSRRGVERFVLISTDKAANPSSIMGATKRVAELIVQSVGAGKETSFVAVRFGNVLGSNGSVIPRMLDQIRAGGPVTVTHPEIRRYFMLISEAVSLVLQAAVLAKGRDTFVLDMGEQIKIVDLAKNLIRLSGFTPDHDIRISFIGLRPGEKLSEELIGAGEGLEPSGTDKIFRVRWHDDRQFKEFRSCVGSLLSAATHGDQTAVVERLCALIPTFVPSRPSPAPPSVPDTEPIASPRGMPATVVAAGSAP
jgi:FlaA1/EpsC-like NDP-sugar epimerase